MLRGVALVAVLLLSGCTSETLATAPPSSSPSPTASTGCRSDEPLREGRHTLTFQGVERIYLLALPRAQGPRPVVLNLHGMGSNAAQQATYSRLPQVGAQRGYIVATPQAAPGRIGWTYPGMGGPDDAGFLGALLDHLERKLCVNRRREFSAGMSNGAGVSVGLICALSGRLAGIAPVAGVNIMPPCAQAKPTTIVAFHGTGDTVVPYRGGHPFQQATGKLHDLGKLITLTSVPKAVTGWAAILGCTGPSERTAADGVRLRSWKRCSGGVLLRLYTVDGGGHTWPGSIKVARLGQTSGSIDATGLLLDAFDATR